MSATASYPNYSPGLEGVIAGITTISEIDSDRSSLVYRGIDVHELAEKGSFEETAYLLLFGKLPDRAELAAFRKTLGEERDVPEAVYTTLRSLPKQTHPMDAIRAAYATLAPFDPDYTRNDHDANLRKATRILAKAGTMVANGHRLRMGLDIVKPDPALNTAANFLYVLNGQKPDEFTEKVMDASLTLYAEHGFNASTFACRVTVATLSDIYSGIITGIGTLKGPLHGGANEEAMKMILEIGTPERAEAWIHDALVNKKKVMGFGHREYKKGDSRAGHMTRMAKEIGRRKGNTTYGDIADILERVMLQEKGLHPNVDFPAAYAYYQLGIPIDLYTPIFVISRVSGWSAHAIEQLDNNRLIRPTVIYEGAHNVPFVPIDER
ncbi:MAG: citrate synthase [Fimbriimonas ginsengisoli]|uniref:Citrate synthase n=1 Tax=Fimbriimonas ginsengisoli TaxID=1005039 RepID=A0A931LVF1_FIMGI|nr:citrate synthase [Fimbriimonas ginsengisoli]